MPYKDKSKQLECQRRWYSNNRKKQIGWIRERKKIIKKWMVKYKSKLKCTKCPECHPSCLEFHHKQRKKEKNFEISRMVGQGYSITRIKEEIFKCIVLCSNCHRKLHFIGL